MPIAAMSLALTLALAIASRQVCSVGVHRSSGSCSTQPDAGKCCGNSCCATAAIDRSAAKIMARDDVVPWSMAITNDIVVFPLGWSMFAQARNRIGMATSSRTVSPAPLERGRNRYDQRTADHCDFARQHVTDAAHQPFAEPAPEPRAALGGPVP